MYNQNTFIGPSFSLKNRLMRVLWGLVDTVLFKYSPRPFHRWRAFILRCFGAKIGKGVHVYPKVFIWAPWNLEIGDESGIANGTTLYSQGKILIGKRVVVSQGVYLCTGSHDYTNKGFPLFTKTIKLADNVWVAAGAFVHPGVTIGEGSVIGAMSVVTKSMPEWMICAGHPCVPIKKRILN